MPPGQAFWWDCIPDNCRWRGVFQGGGAKGVTYAGALQAMEREGQWFSSVAGSSAGALTAALVAAGFTPDELALKTPSMLSAISPSSVADRVLYRLGATRALTRYDATELERVLEEYLREGVARHGVDSDGDVTFAELSLATRIDLYVLALDASAGLPIPFCTATTPDLSVSTAVIASCAIPMAFPSLFIEIEVSPWRGWPPLRRLMDGGAWANFPIFIYRDAAFRDFHGLSELVDGSPVVGFIFDNHAPDVEPARPSRFTDDPYRRWNSKLADLVVKRRPETSRADEGANENRVIEHVVHYLTALRDGLLDLLVVGLVLLILVLLALGIAALTSWLIALICMALVVLGLSFVARRIALLFREGMGALQSLVAHATTPPIWAGLMTDTMLVFVPRAGIGTTEFKLPRSRIDRGIKCARVSCRRQIRQALGGATFYQVNRQVVLDVWASIRSDHDLGAGLATLPDRRKPRVRSRG